MSSDKRLISPTEKLPPLCDMDEDKGTVNNVMLDPNEPKDVYNIVYIAHVVLGVGLLFPWNAWISPFDYWREQFHTKTFDFPFVFFLAIVFNWAAVGFLLFSVFCSRHIPAKIRIWFVFGPELIVMALVPFMKELVVDPGARVGALYAMAFVCGGSTALGFGVIMGMAAQFPFKYTVAVMMGNGVGGVVVGLIRVITKAAFGESNADLATLIYFLIAAFLMLMCLITYFAIQKLPFAKFHLEKGVRKQSVEVVSQALLNTDSDEELELHQRSTIGGVFKKIRMHMLSVFLVFFLSLVLFPGFTGLIPTTHSGAHDPFRSWFGVVMVFLFQFWDWIGRSLPQWFVIIKPKWILIPVISRVLFAVLFVLCVNPRIFASDWAAYAIMSVFALTNGYLGTLSMSFGVGAVEPFEQDLAGNMMSFALNFGIFCATHFAILLLWATAPCQLPTFFIPANLHEFCNHTATSNITSAVYATVIQPYL